MLWRITLNGTQIVGVDWIFTSQTRQTENSLSHIRNSDGLSTESMHKKLTVTTAVGFLPDLPPKLPSQKWVWSRVKRNSICLLDNFD